MNENWCTLAIAVFYERPCTIEQAFELYNYGKISKSRPKPKPKEDVEDMIKLRKNLTLQEVADIYCIDKSTVYRILRNFKNKKKLPQEAK